jgi:hypothetical protein
VRHTGRVATKTLLPAPCRRSPVHTHCPLDCGARSGHSVHAFKGRQPRVCASANRYTPLFRPPFPPKSVSGASQQWRRTSRRVQRPGGQASRPVRLLWRNVPPGMPRATDRALVANLVTGVAPAAPSGTDLRAQRLRFRERAPWAVPARPLAPERMPRLPGASRRTVRTTRRKSLRPGPPGHAPELHSCRVTHAPSLPQPNHPLPAQVSMPIPPHTPPACYPDPEIERPLRAC